MTDPHAVLRVAPTARADELRRAWRRRARQTHPDHGGDPDAFAAVHQAYRLLVSRALTPASPVLVRRLGPAAVAARWWRRRDDRVRRPRVV